MSKAEKPFAGKKILFTSHRTGFANTFNRPLIKLLKDGGAEVHYASNGEEPAGNCDKDFAIDITRNPLSLGNIRAINQLKKIIDKEKYDMIHCHTPTGGVVTRLAARASRKQGTKVLYTAHGFHFFKGAPVRNWLIFYPIEKLLSYFTDSLLTINEEDYLRARDDFRTDVRYVSGVGLDKSAMNVHLTRNEKLQLRESLGLSEKDYVAIYPAELSKRKRQKWLVDNVAHTLRDNPRVHILLPGRDGLDGSIQRQIELLGLESQIHLLGFRNDIPSLLSISDIAISTSLQEGLPVNVMEALHYGLCVLATDCRGNADLLKGVEDCYIVPRFDAGAFEKQLRSLISRPSLSLNRRSKLNKIYYLGNTLPVMHSLYSEILL